ncbi:MAG: hypothetical protein ACLPX1_07945 [Steroidobacteraceae bacterium]
MLPLRGSTNDIRAEQWEIGKLQLPAAELEVLDEANRLPADYRGSPPFKH